MEVILIFGLLTLVSLALWLVYRLLKWLFANKTRALRTSFACLTLIWGAVIYQQFFISMDFIQSEVYPDLYLVKHPVKDTSALYDAVEKFAKTTVESSKTKSSNHALRFYLYSNHWNPLIFGDAGTSYFIDHEEDFGGFSVEELSMYRKEKLATLAIIPCEKDGAWQCGQLQFYKDGDVIKTKMIKLK